MYGVFVICLHVIFFPGLQKTPNFFTSYSIQDSNQGTTIIREPGFCIKGESFVMEGGGWWVGGGGGG